MNDKELIDHLRDEIDRHNLRCLILKKMLSNKIEHALYDPVNEAVRQVVKTND